MKIDNVLPTDYPECLALWENSVRATHDFITEEDIESFKPMIIEQAFPAVDLFCIKDVSGRILGFIGTLESKIEMLFVLNESRGKGVGRCLMTHALETLQCTKVDVNEQNPQAVEFYKHLGFRIVSRSETDDMGNPYPILHMAL